MEVKQRILKVGIERDNEIKWYQGLRIVANGVKYANPLQNECTVMISGLNTDTRDYIITETSIHNKKRKAKKIFVEAGREGEGSFMVYSGDIVQVQPSMPPDVTLNIISKTMNNYQYDVVSRVGESIESTRARAAEIAKDLGVKLVFEATEKNISNYQHSGDALSQVQKIQEWGDYKAFIDDGNLYVMDKDKPLTNKKIILNKNSGMVGIPQLTERGVNVAFLLNPDAKIGGMLEIQSEFNKAANGNYIIEQLNFEVANHDDSFFYIAECRKYG